MKRQGSATDPLWYKDAIIYELHIRAFADSNNDGIGDFQGLISKLDYLQDLGITCIWILPFFPSPLRDDGYDIADYKSVNPAYGSLNDFTQFLDAAHLRNMQVMIELVINHTSDQHPWFQAARVAPSGSPERDMYVWSDTDKKYQGVRIIFTDTEKSNWTWDDQAKSFYWHRFFSHQPDLNFDNPRVMEEVLSAMRFWLDMGVDALRLDAIPYLIERDGTNCENVPETHVKIKEIRAVIDREYDNRLILAEANMWPQDVRPYFGDGDECHMAFHFPLMPRIYMALRQEDRVPITDIMAQTPEIPDGCQWGLFLRNHDELTLEMVTDDERDYMYLAYSADPRMRINVGIRRRLAPLVDNNRRRIELLNSLLLSFPGTPIMYYGDELGMGDNIYLGDRNGVRTPMQWNSDRNAGFSKCDPARLYFPVVMDPIYGYQVVNVEAQLSDQSSLLHWTRNMIALRKLFQVFGRGSLEFLEPSNRKILAYLRKLTREDGSSEIILCVANLSRFAQPVSLALSEYAGSTPIEMLGYVSFPSITNQPYPLTLAPYSFLWFEIQPSTAIPETTQGSSNANVSQGTVGRSFAQKGWEILRTAELKEVEAAISSWLPKQRWFGAKSRQIKDVRLHDWIFIPERNEKNVSFTLEFEETGIHSGSALCLFEITYSDGTQDVYQVPLAFASSLEPENDSEVNQNSVVLRQEDSATNILLYDAFEKKSFRDSLLRLIEDEEELSSSLLPETGGLQGRRLDKNGDWTKEVSRLGSAEQSNTNILYGDKMILKFFRRLVTGINPDVEINLFLGKTADFKRLAPLLGDIKLKSSIANEWASVGMIQQFVKNDGDAWKWTMEESARFYQSVSSVAEPVEEGAPASFLSGSRVSPQALEHAGLYLEAAFMLGKRTAELHVALCRPTDDQAFSAEPFTREDLISDAERIEVQLNLTLGALKMKLFSLKDKTAVDAAELLERRTRLFSYASSLSSAPVGGVRCRIHGDYHLGQLLRVKNDFIIIDFEGEPARSLEERRRKQSPLRDVAGMLRSFSYAAAAGLSQYLQRYPEKQKVLEPWARTWQNAVSTQFLSGYKSIAAEYSHLFSGDAQSDVLLSAYIMEKGLYELLYELNNRPAWVQIPLSGLLNLREFSLDGRSEAKTHG